MIPTTRAEAKAMGQKRFVTGKPCARGHVGPRSVHRGECLGCISERRFAQRCDPAVREELNRRDRERQRRSYQDPELRRRRLDCNSASKRRRRTRGNP